MKISIEFLWRRTHELTNASPPYARVSNISPLLLKTGWLPNKNLLQLNKKMEELLLSKCYFTFVQYDLTDCNMKKNIARYPKRKVLYSCSGIIELLTYCYFDRALLLPTDFPIHKQEKCTYCILDYM